MPDLNAALSANRAAVNDLIAASERSSAVWSKPRAGGKWSPAQIVEHVGRSLEESSKVAAGQPANFPKFPFFLRPILRRVLFYRVLRTEAFPKGKTNKAMNPERGPASPSDARVRLESVTTRFEQAFRALAAKNAGLESTIFGTVPVEEYVRFMELHTRHHIRQMPQS